MSSMMMSKFFFVLKGIKVVHNVGVYQLFHYLRFSFISLQLMSVLDFGITFMTNSSLTLQSVHLNAAPKPLSLILVFARTSNTAGKGHIA